MLGGRGRGAPAPKPWTHQSGRPLLLPSQNRLDQEERPVLLTSGREGEALQGQSVRWQVLARPLGRLQTTHMNGGHSPRPGGVLESTRGIYPEG